MKLVAGSFSGGFPVLSVPPLRQAEPNAPPTVDNSGTWAAVAVAAALGFFGWRRAGNQATATEQLAMVSTSGEVVGMFLFLSAGL